MGPCFALPLAALACCLLPAGCCVTCDSAVMDAVKSLEKNYLPGHLDAKQRNKVMDMVHSTLKDFQDRPFLEGSFAGFIDKKSLEEASQDLVNELKRITDSDIKGDELVSELNKTMVKEKEAFSQKANHFQKEAYCPNKCGIMFQTLIWCQHCDKKVHTCRKSINCGEQHVEVHEAEDFTLDCLLSWHHISEGLTDYRFYRVWENSSETLLYKGKEHMMKKTRVTEADEGKYRCEMGTVFLGPASVISFHVTVLPPNFHQEEHVEHLEADTDTPPPDESHTSETATSPHPLPNTSLQPSQAQSMLQGRLFGLLICFFILLVVALLLRLIYWQKSKEKHPSRPSLARSGSKASSVRTARTGTSRGIENTSSKSSRTASQK